MHAAERGELEAFRDFYAAAPPELGADMKPVGGALCLRLEPLSTVTMFNRVLGLGIGEPASEAQLDEALGFVHGVQAYVTVAPEAMPADLGEQLAARGLAPDRGWTKFSRSTADPPQASTGLRVERDDRGEAFAEAATHGFEMPDLFLGWLRCLPGREGWQCFVAFDGDAPAAAGALYVTHTELHEVLAHVFAGRLKPVVDRTFPLQETRAAHEDMEKSQMFGKIVLQLDAPLGA